MLVQLHHSCAHQNIIEKCMIHFLHAKKPIVIPGKVYTHYKNGRYTVLCLTEESTNARKGNNGGVVYVSLTYGKIKHRDFDEFTELVEWPDGKMRPRFILEEAIK